MIMPNFREIYQKLGQNDAINLQTSNFIHVAGYCLLWLVFVSGCGWLLLLYFFDETKQYI